MKFKEIPVDVERFTRVMPSIILDNVEHIRNDFEDIMEHNKVRTDVKIDDLMNVKTDSFINYCFGIMSVFNKESRLYKSMVK